VEGTADGIGDRLLVSFLVVVQPKSRKQARVINTIAMTIQNDGKRDEEQ